MENLKKYLDFGFKKIDLLGIFAVIFCFVIVKIFNITEIYENSILENMQLVPLFLGAVFCFTAKKHKPFYIIVGLFLILFFLRELSYGRVIYGAIPNSPHDFYPLSHFKYGYLTNIFIGIYLALIFIFGAVKKVWVDIIDIVKKVKFPVWTFLFAVIFIAFEICGEKADNTIIEEIAELAIYCFTFSICYIYIKTTNKE